jgi:uncharacterized membrane protein
LGGRSVRRALSVLGLAFGLVTFVAPSEAGSKSYRFTDVVIDATILHDGSLELVERRTFDFEGSFSTAYFTIDWAPELIEDFRVTRTAPNGADEPLSVDIQRLLSQFKATWHFSVTDELATFRISYRVRCAVDVYEDTSHLLWQFVGTGWPEPTERVHVKLHVPGRATGDVPARPSEVCKPVPVTDLPHIEAQPLATGEVRAWGHGPLGGEVRIPDPQTVTFDVQDLPPRTFVEGSVLFSPDSVPLAFQRPETKRANILAEEAELAREANALRRQFHRNRGTSTVLAFIIPLLMAALVVIAYRRDRVPDVPRHLQEPPEGLHPVELAYLWSAYRGRLSPKTAYRTQLLHLVRLRAIELSAVGLVTQPEDIRIRLRKMPQRRGLDRDFVEFLFEGDGSKVKSMRELTANTGRQASELRDWVRRLQVKTRENVRRITSAGVRMESWILAALALGTLGWAIVSDSVGGLTAVLSTIAALLFGLAAMAIISFIRRGSVRGSTFGTILALVAVTLLVLPAVALTESFGLGADRGALLVLVTVGMWVAALRMMPERLDPDLRARVARWKAFRRFLKEFSTLPDAPVLAVIVWEQYLVLATALDVAKKVERQVKALIPAEEIPSPLPGVPPGLESLRLIGGFNGVNVSAAAFHTASSSGSSSFSSGIGSFSSATGFGGGFSDGGGGGGGGTGGGAD